MEEKRAKAIFVVALLILAIPIGFSLYNKAQIGQTNYIVLPPSNTPSYTFNAPLYLLTSFIPIPSVNNGIAIPPSSGTINVITTTGSPTLWLCGAASNGFGRAGVITSYVQDVSDGDVGVAFAGHQYGNGCYTSQVGGGIGGIAGVAIGLNNGITPYVSNVFGPGSPTTSGSLSFPTSNSFVAIIVSCGDGACDGVYGSITVPSGCIQQQLEDFDGRETSALYTCNSISGTKTVTVSSAASAEMALASYTFTGYSVTSNVISLNFTSPLALVGNALGCPTCGSGGTTYTAGNNIAISPTNVISLSVRGNTINGAVAYNNNGVLNETNALTFNYGATNQLTIGGLTRIGNLAGQTTTSMQTTNSFTFGVGDTMNFFAGNGGRPASMTLDSKTGSFTLQGYNIYGFANGASGQYFRINATDIQMGDVDDQQYLGSEFAVDMDSPSPLYGDIYMNTSLDGYLNVGNDLFINGNPGITQNGLLQTTDGIATAYNPASGSMYVYTLGAGSNSIYIAATDTFNTLNNGITAGITSNVVFQNANALKISRPGLYQINWDISVEIAAANQEAECSVAINHVVNNTMSAHTEQADSGRPFSMGGTGLINLKQNDVVQIGCLEHTAIHNIEVDHMTLTATRVG